MPTEVNKNYSQNVELLKLVSIVVIVLYHIGCMVHSDNIIIKYFSSLTQRLWMIIDVLLALGGYIFYKSLNTNRSDFSLLKTRLTNIIPGYFLFLIIYITMGIPLQNYVGNNFSFNSNYFWLTLLTFTSNIPLSFQFSGVALEGFFSICLLIQFYFLFSILFKYIKTNRNRLITISLFEVMAIFLRFLPIFNINEWGSYFFTFTRIDSFLTGIFLAILLENRAIRKTLIEKRILILVFSVLPLLIIAPFSHFLSLHHPLITKLGYPLIAIMNFGLINVIINGKPIRKFIPNMDNFFFAVFLIRLPFIYLLKGILGYEPGSSIEMTLFFMFLSFTLLMLWGIIHHNFSKKKHLTISIRTLNKEG